MRLRDTKSQAKQRSNRAGMTLLFACLLLSIAAVVPSRCTSLDDAPAPRRDETAWDRILTQYVDDAGLVAYHRIAIEVQAELADYLAWLAAVDPTTMSPQDQLAFWINAYNAGIVAAVLRDYSPESTLSRAQMFHWFTFSVAGKDRTPDEIEHQILHKQFHEPRIHFAVLCGASGCPKLRREAYHGDRLDQQLDDQARRFINDPTRNRIDPARHTVELSSIFNWFAADFTAAAGSVVNFVARYVDAPEHVAVLNEQKEHVRFLDYDWSLNAQRTGNESGAVCG